MAIEINTQQQAVAVLGYETYVNEMKYLDLPFSKFWEWYSSWCIEQGLFNDRASYQSDSE